MNPLACQVVVKSFRLLFPLSLVVLIFVALGETSARAQATSTWTGRGGEWAPCPPSGGALWSTCPTYPDGNYLASIQGGPVTMTTSAASVADLSLSSGSNLEIAGGYLDITGNSITNDGTITIVSGNGLAIIGQGATVTLSGGGTVSMTTANSVFGGTAGTSPTLINRQMITGQGTLGGGFTLDNQGTINAVGGTLAVRSDLIGITNSSLMEASSGGTLEIVFGADAPFNNAGGLVEALNGGIVQLQDGIYTGGTLTTTGTGVIQLSGDALLNSLTNSGTLQLSNSSALLENTMTNTGTIQVQSGTLFMAGNVTLAGSGSLLMGGSSSNLEQNATSVGPSGGSLINQQLIHGGGTFYDLPLTNQATIEADNKSAPLYLDTATTNTGMLEASGGATLDIYPGQTVNNAGGVIEALTGSTVRLQGTISGGTLETSGTGVIEDEDGTLDGTVNVPTNTGKLNVANGSYLYVQGSVNNTGTITLGTDSCLEPNQATTLTGSGKVIMGTSSCIYGSGGVALINQSTIEGTGGIGQSSAVTFTNNGTVLANKSTPLTIQPDSAGFTNNGKLIVSKGSELIINSRSTDPFNNLSGGTLTGGTYTVTGLLEVGDAITSNAASITLIGPTAEILSSSTTNALATLAANTTKGALSLQTGQALATSTSFASAGKTTVGAGSSFTVGGSYTQAAGTTTVDGTLTAPAGLDLQKGTLLGKGTLVAGVTSNATVIVGDAATKAGVLTVTGSYSQQSAGVLDVAIGGTTAGSQYSQLPVSNGVSLAGTLTIKLINSFVPAIGDTFTILTGSALTGQFAKVNGSTINSGEHFEVSCTPTAVTLTVVSGV